jgi:hypothetical protein
MVESRERKPGVARMSDHAVSFGGSRLFLGYDLERRFAEWESLRLAMVRGVPDEFTRDEWAYLIAFIAHESLRQVFVKTFGPPGGADSVTMFRPRGAIAIWLPNNVSLLGPLLVVLASFSGTPVRVKAGSRSDDLCAAFIRYAVENLAEGELRAHLRTHLRIERFDRKDDRNATMAAEAAVRIAFGSNEAVAAIHGLRHPIDSIGISFGDHQSEAWVEASALSDAVVATLLKVFAIYGRAGCTSPRRVVMIDGTPAECDHLLRRMIESWPAVIRRDAPMHVASQNVLYAQLGTADGWTVRVAPRHGAVFGVGRIDMPDMAGPMSLSIVAGSVDEAIASLPMNIQTVGTALMHSGTLLPRIVQTKVKRFVPLAEMHHFGPIWDGQNFFRHFFEEIAVG